MGLDVPCGRTRRLRDFACCGETWTRLADEAARGEHAAPDNTPREAETVAAYAELATTILDPVEAHFGPITLTYGFAGPALTREIDGRIYPALDQHAGHERTAKGKVICERGGAAVDFFCEGVSSADVARWIVAELPFDRLYFYGADRPLHVSVGPQRAGQVTLMLPGPSGRRVPRVVRGTARIPG